MQVKRSAKGKLSEKFLFFFYFFHFELDFFLSVSFNFHFVKKIMHQNLFSMDSLCRFNISFDFDIYFFIKSVPIYE